MLLYLPALLIVVIIWGISEKVKIWMKGRKKDDESVMEIVLICSICKETYTREELDISATATPKCPRCEYQLEIHE
jgi:hypothetical protein